MNTGFPAVSGDGAMGALTPFEITASDVKADGAPFPANWPAHRAPTAEEQARIQAAMQRRERLVENAQ